jgi:hypothetical protein
MRVHDLRDFRPDLRSAIDQLREAGYYGEAFVLTAALEGAYRTASEMVGGIGGAVLRVERRLGANLPVHVVATLDSVLDEIRKVCPALH